MTRPAPQAVPRRLALVRGVLLPDRELRVGGHLAGPREPIHLTAIGGDERERQREDEDEPCRRLEEDEASRIRIDTSQTQIIVELAPTAPTRSRTKGEEIIPELYSHEA